MTRVWNQLDVRKIPNKKNVTFSRHCWFLPTCRGNIFALCGCHYRADFHFGMYEKLLLHFMNSLSSLSQKEISKSKRKCSNVSDAGIPALSLLVLKILEHCCSEPKGWNLERICPVKYCNVLCCMTFHNGAVTNCLQLFPKDIFHPFAENKTMFHQVDLRGKLYLAGPLWKVKSQAVKY